VQAAALCAAQVGALALTWSESRIPQQQEALIGVLFVLAACAGILLLASNPHGGEHLQNLLVGQIVWVSWKQLGWLAAITVALLLALQLSWVRRLGRFGFYGAFALAITASVQLVGVYLVFSSLIIPALATRNLSGRRRHLVGYGLGGSRVCDRPCAVGPVRSAFRRRDRLHPGGVRGPFWGSRSSPFADPRPATGHGSMIVMRKARSWGSQRPPISAA
jgi:ABC-type Mn2+/Zn2+ transport system permease subunit